MKRSHLIERLDSPDVSDDDLESLFKLQSTLAYLTGTHRAFVRFLSSCSKRWSPGVSISILVLRCGRGDLAREIIDWAREFKLDIKLMAVDNYARVVHRARAANSAYPEITFDVRDFRDPVFLQAQQFDYVLSCSAMHMETEGGAVLFLKTANRLAKRGIMISDWIRDPRAGFWMKCGGRFSSNEAVRWDVVQAIRRSFTISEVKQLMSEAGMDYLSLRKQFGYRFCLSGERGLVMSQQLSPLANWAGA